MSEYKERCDYNIFENSKDYEYTNNMVYEFHIRNKKNSDKFEIFNENSEEFKNNFTISDIVLFETENSKKTLQDIIFNIYPSIYEEFKNDTKLLVDISLDVFEEYTKDDTKYEFKETIYFDSKKKEYVVFTKIMMEKLINKFKTSHKIKPKFKKPSVLINKNTIINIYNLNLSLPDGEIFSYILELKKKFRLKIIKKTQIKQFKEFMKSRETKKNSYTKKDFKKQMQKKLKYFEVLFNTMKLDDIFYVYDNYTKYKVSFLTLRNDLIEFRINRLLLKFTDDYPGDNFPKELLKTIEYNIYGIKNIFDTNVNFSEEEEKINPNVINELTKYTETLKQICIEQKKDSLVKEFFTEPFILTTRTVRNYLKTAKFYIEEENYKKLLD